MTGDKGGRCSQISLLLYTLLFWVSGFVLIFIAIWALVDPRRSYILDLVDFSEEDPLLRGAAYLAIITGSLSLVIGFIACCGAIKRARCLIVTLVMFLIIIFFADIAIGTLSIVYRDKFAGGRMGTYIANLSKNRYNRDYWVAPLLDTIQYYQHCCGGLGPRDYQYSFWYKTNVLRGTRSFVPPSCCRQTQHARAWQIQPVDPMCTTYSYYSSAFNNSVNVEGCHERLLSWLDAQTAIFAAVAFSFSAFQIIGICIAVSLFRHANTYHYIDS